jgi:hypothetical protein
MQRVRSELLPALQPLLEQIFSSSSQHRQSSASNLPSSPNSTK